MKPLFCELSKSQTWIDVNKLQSRKTHAVVQNAVRLWRRQISGLQILFFTRHKRNWRISEIEAHSPGSSRLTSRMCAAEQTSSIEAQEPAHCPTNDDINNKRFTLSCHVSSISTAKESSGNVSVKIDLEQALPWNGNGTQMTNTRFLSAPHVPLWLMQRHFPFYPVPKLIFSFGVILCDVSRLVLLFTFS